MVHFFFEQGTLSGLVTAFIICLLLAATGYFLAFRHLGLGRLQSLIVLRVIAIVVVLLLLFRPVLSYHKICRKSRP